MRRFLWQGVAILTGLVFLGLPHVTLAQSLPLNGHIAFQTTALDFDTDLTSPACPSGSLQRFDFHNGSPPFDLVITGQSTVQVRNLFNSLPGVQAAFDFNGNLTYVITNGGRPVTISGTAACLAFFGLPTGCTPPTWLFEYGFNRSQTRLPINDYGQAIVLGTATLPFVCDLAASLPDLNVGDTLFVTVGGVTAQIDITDFETPFSIASRMTTGLGSAGFANVDFGQKLYVMANDAVPISIAGFAGNTDIVQNRAAPIDLTTLPNVTAGAQFDIDPGNGTPFTVTISGGDTAYDLAAQITSALTGNGYADINHNGQLLINSDFSNLQIIDNTLGIPGLAALGLSVGSTASISNAGLDALGFENTQPPGTADGRESAPRNLFNYDGNTLTETYRGLNDNAKVIGTVNLRDVTDLTALPNIDAGDTFTIDPGNGNLITVVIESEDTLVSLAAKITAASATTTTTNLPIGACPGTVPPGCTCTGSNGSCVLTTALMTAGATRSGQLFLTTSFSPITIGAGTLGSGGLAQLGLSAGSFGAASTFIANRDILNVTPPDLVSAFAGINNGETFEIDPGDGGGSVVITINNGDTATTLANKITAALGTRGSALINSNGQLEITSNVGGVTIIQGSLSLIGMVSLGFQTIPQSGAVFTSTTNIFKFSASDPDIILTDLPNVDAGDAFSVDPGTGTPVTITINLGDTVFDLVDTINQAIGNNGQATLTSTGGFRITTGGTGNLVISDISLGAAGMADLGISNISITPGSGPATATQTPQPFTFNRDTMIMLDANTSILTSNVFAETTEWQGACITPRFDISGIIISSTLCDGTPFMQFLEDINQDIAAAGLDALAFFNSSGSITLLNNGPAITISGVSCSDLNLLGGNSFRFAGGCSGAIAPPTPPPPPPPPSGGVPAGIIVPPILSAQDILLSRGLNFAALAGGFAVQLFLNNLLALEQTPALQDMAQQLHVGKMDLARLEGGFEDASGFLTTQRKLQSADAEQALEQPSELSCSGAIASDGLIRASKVAQTGQRILANEALAESTNKVGSSTEFGAAAHLKKAYDEYTDFFCNPNHNSGTSNCTPSDPDRDILFGENILNALTVDYSRPEDRRALRAALRILTNPLPNTPIAADSIEDHTAQQQLYLQRRRKSAWRDVSTGVLAGIIARRLPAINDDSLNIEYVRWLREIQDAAGIPDSVFAGKDPSLNEIMFTIAKLRPFWPGYFARLGTERSIEMEQNFLDAMTQKQMRMIFKRIEEINTLMAIRTTLKVEERLVPTSGGNDPLIAK